MQRLFRSPSRMATPIPVSVGYQSMGSWRRLLSSCSSGLAPVDFRSQDRCGSRPYQPRILGPSCDAVVLTFISPSNAKKTTYI